MKLKSLKAAAPLFVLLFMMLSGPAVLAGDDAAIRGPLTCQIEYWSVGQLGERGGRCRAPRCRSRRVCG